METENNNNSLYKYSENTIKKINLELYENIINYTNLDIKFKEKFYLYENKIELPYCECGNNVSFIDMNKGFREFCSKKCMYNSKSISDRRKLTNIKKYGVDNPAKSKIIKEKVKESNLSKFGVEYPLQSKYIVEKSKKIFTEKYGVDNPSKVKEIRDKAEITMLEKYGVKYAMQSDIIKNNLKNYFNIKYGVDNPSKVKEIRDKAEITMLEKYGVKYALQNDLLLNKMYNTNIMKFGVKSFTMTNEYNNIIKNNIFIKNSIIVNNNRYLLVETNISEYIIKCNKCNKLFTIQRQLWRNRKFKQEEVCLNCNIVNNIISNDEKKLLTFIIDNYEGDIITSDREILKGKELDIYLPELNLAFEFNGLYWHSELYKDKKYHQNKTKECLDKGVQLIHIWEDDWNYKQEIVKSIILNKLGNSKRIFARKCEIKKPDNKEVRDFLVRNHIQGFVGSKVKIGLYFENKLVSLMTFGNLRKSLGQKSSDNTYELLRFCNKLEYSVVGGASKLFKHFIENNYVKNIISYSDNSRGFGNLYKQLGFESISETVPNYYWYKNGIKEHRFNYRKDKLIKEGFDSNKTEVQIMNERGFFRIFDCGNKKWLYIKK